MNSLRVENNDGRYHELHHNNGRTREVLLLEVVKVELELEQRLQSPSRLSFARGRSIRMIICKRPVDQDDPFQKAGRSG